MRASRTQIVGWSDLLVQETAEIDRAGVSAAIVAVRLTADNEADLATDARRAESLLRRRLRPSDRFGASSPNSFSLLLSPTNEITETIEQVRNYGKTLFDHRIPARTAFAHRRPHESLVDTWARSEAELDRVLYRSSQGHIA